MLLHKVIIMCELQSKKLNLFCESNTIKSVLKVQIIAAINPINLKELKKSTMETIQHTTHQI